jgi:hypothetical protein
MNLGYMMHLIQTKNDLNRKRRRFYAIMHGRKEYIRLHEQDKRYRKEKDYCNGHIITVVHFHPAYSKVEGKRGYQQTKEAMKAMTKHMKEVRIALRAKYHWDCRGAIHSVSYEGVRYHEKDIARLAKHYRAEKILVGEE